MKSDFVKPMFEEGNSPPGFRETGPPVKAARASGNQQGEQQ
jgi:hypothetical protein